MSACRVADMISWLQDRASQMELQSYSGSQGCRSATESMEEPLLGTAGSPAPSKVDRNAPEWQDVAAKSQLKSVVRAGKGKGGKDFKQSNQSFDFDMYESYVCAELAGLDWSFLHHVAEPEGTLERPVLCCVIHVLCNSCNPICRSICKMHVARVREPPRCRPSLAGFSSSLLRA